ncbi:hypothetical protein EYF88_05850 [Paracoccus sediminis]|uniref:Uncharacterized protein n=1 Tax=Paracoccus sediminis TaxID=1214787 RepID=A0A238VVQ2_9RHOB|nr:hypothetical protein [Paracoccus sediminis]TBN51327.1 hypothetical protein EYF88_05850 [Paracoccus sediminis]SNR38261.1 hypothetical protein SAMN06265378_10379 [Paracoccus sediminis]
MAAFFRLILFLLIAETVFYVLLRVYLRSLRTERLEDRWNERHPAMPGNTPARRAFVRRSMAGFDRTLRSRLLLLVFVLPNLAVAGIIYWVNWQ